MIYVGNGRMVEFNAKEGENLTFYKIFKFLTLFGMRLKKSAKTWKNEKRNIQILT